MREVVIVSAVRTPVGSFLGALSNMHPARLGAIAIAEAVKRAGISGEDVDEVIMGCVLPAGLGQAPARQACIYAGLPTKVECLTINKVCGSGLKSVMLAAQAIQAGDAEVIVAGGMESMSGAPYLVPKARSGYRMGNGTLEDCMIKDGLWDPYNDFHMGTAANMLGEEYNISRTDQDDFAIESLSRALKAQKEGLFADEIVPVEVPQKKGDPVLFTEDEGPKRGNPEKMRKLKPAFVKDGTVTAGNASSINDGAGAVVVMSADKAKELGVEPMVRIAGQSSAARPSEWFTLAPIDAMKKVFAKMNITKDDIDIYEINEAFAVVVVAAMREFELDHSIVNVHGGAVPIGHPIGGSGTRVLVTLLHAMKRYDKKRGLACLCIGGGEASALVVERQ